MNFETVNKMFEVLKIPYGRLMYVIHIIRLGLRYSTASGFEDERKWLLEWCKNQEESLEKE